MTVFGLQGCLEYTLASLRHFKPGEVSRYASKIKDDDWICICVQESVPNPECELCKGSGNGHMLLGVAIAPREPCPHEPGTVGKLAWLCHRYANGIQLFDVKDEVGGKDADICREWGTEKPEFFESSIRPRFWRSAYYGIEEND